MLSGLLPQCLVENYIIWRTGKLVLRGYLRAEAGNNSSGMPTCPRCLVPTDVTRPGRRTRISSQRPPVFGKRSPTCSDCKEDQPNKKLYKCSKLCGFITCEDCVQSGRRTARRSSAPRGSELYIRLHRHCDDCVPLRTVVPCSAQVWRLPSKIPAEAERLGKYVDSDEYADAADEEVANSRDVNPMMLINPLSATPGSFVWHLVRLFTRLECLSDILIWSKSNPRVACGANKLNVEPFAVHRLELARLNLSFSVRPFKTSHVLYSNDFSEFRVADLPTLGASEGGLPHRESRMETRAFADAKDQRARSTECSALQYLLDGIQNAVLLKRKEPV